MIVAKFENAADGIESLVAHIDRGYSVTVRDTDANECVPLHIIFPTLEAAIAKAKAIVG